MTAIVYTSDLMLQSQIAAAARGAGRDVAIAPSSQALFELAGQQHLALVVLDLSEPSLNLADLVPKLRARFKRPTTILAFGPHVQRDRLAAAAEAGCDRVISRGQFHSQMADLFAAMTPGPEAGD